MQPKQEPPPPSLVFADHDIFDKEHQTADNSNSFENMTRTHGSSHLDHILQTEPLYIDHRLNGEAASHNPIQNPGNIQRRIGSIEELVPHIGGQNSLMTMIPPNKPLGPSNLNPSRPHTSHPNQTLSRLHPHTGVELSRAHEPHSTPTLISP